MSKTYISVSLRKLVWERAKDCCEYCLIPQTVALARHQVDQVIAEKHGGETDAENLALSCTLCNQAKGSDVDSIDPETGDIERFYHPRCDRWSEHFQLLEATGEIEPLTAIGRSTLRLLQMNRPEYLDLRRILLQMGVLQEF
jgi:HNH endonuclease